MVGLEMPRIRGAIPASAQRGEDSLAENPSKMGPNQRTGNIFKKTHCQGGSLPIERRRSLRRLQRSAANDGESDRLLSITWRQAFASSRCAVMVAVP